MTGRPARSVAARSSPPSSRSSAMPGGRRRSGTPCPAKRRNRASQPSRTGPARARSTTPPKPPGSTASAAAARAASRQRSLRSRSLAHPSTSATARSIRAVEPVSSSGSRRSRWRSAEGATSITSADRRRPASLQRGQRPRRPDQRQLAPQPVGAQRRAQPRRRLQHRVGRRHPAQPLAGRDDRPPLGRLGPGPALGEPHRVAVIGVPPAHHLDPVGDLARRAHLDRQPEAVEQLRPQLALLRIARPDQHEARRMAHAQALALHDVLARGGDVEQQVDQMVLQQVDLVDIEEPAMGAGQQPRLEPLLAARQRPLQIERADDPVLGRAERQVDDRRRHLHHRRTAGADPADRRRPVRRAVVGAALARRDRRQQRRQRAHRRGLAGAPVAKDQHAADRRVDRRDAQRALHLVLPDDRRERKH